MCNSHDPHGNLPNRTVMGCYHVGLALVRYHHARNRDRVNLVRRERAILQQITPSAQTMYVDHVPHVLTLWLMLYLTRLSACRASSLSPASIIC